MQISAISGRCGRQSLRETPSPFSVQLDSSDRFSAKDDSGIYGRILSEHGQMIQGLLEEPTLELYVSCTIDGEPTTRKSDRSSVQMPCFLSITVYGRLELFDEIGSWFQEYEVYLQDPLVCHLNLRYCNPQRLSSEDLESCRLVSEVVSQTSKLVHLQDITERPELLDILSSHADLEETPQPAVIQATLKRYFTASGPLYCFHILTIDCFRHQKQALTFMLRREQGWAFHDKQPDIWEAIETNQGRL
jgi:hypothetical protein